MALSKKMNQTVAACFSDDIFVEILKRLPVSSLIKSMLVQKSWYDLIKTPYFNALYSHHQKNNYILFRNHHGRHVALRVNNNGCYQHYSLPIPVPEKFMGGYYSCPISSWSISNGLVCFYYWELSQLQQIHLWNPIIRKFKTLPHSPILYDDPLCRPLVQGLAFGYLSMINDYKVIKIEKYPAKGGTQSNFVCVYVYSLSTNSWKIVNQENFVGLEHLEEDSVVVKGSAYWLGRTDQLSRIVVCFDIEKDIIREIMLPPQCPKNVNRVRVTLFQKFSDLSLFYIDLNGIIDIWILEKEAEIKDGWTKRFTLNFHDNVEGYWGRWWPEGFRNNDEIMLINYRSECKYMSYNIEKGEPTETIDDLCLALDVKPGDLIHSSLLVASLVLLGDN